MARLKRHDAPGLQFHVMNRGIGHRPIFEGAADIRCFQAQVARAVRARWIEVYAFCLMPNHFHMLVGSVQGRLDVGMQWSQDAFARWFNLTRGRDGALFRGRYRAKLVDDPVHRYLTIRYIDWNPVEAGLAACPSAYPYGSAFHYSRPSGPPWLARALVEGLATRRLGSQVYDPTRYDEFVGKGGGRQHAIIERLIESSAVPAKDMRNLFGASPPHVQSWYREMASRADGGTAGVLLLHPDTVSQIIAEPIGGLRSSHPELPGRLWRSLEAGLLHHLAGQRVREIAERTGTSPSTACADIREHVRALDADPLHRQLAAEVLRRGLEIDYGGG